jgi:conjugal transfer pilus assembly protein TrbC
VNRYIHPHRLRTEGRRLWRGLCWLYKQFAIFVFVVFATFTAVAWYRGSHAADLATQMPNNAAIEKSMAEQREKSANIMNQVEQRARAYQSAPPPLRLPEASLQKGLDPLTVAKSYRVKNAAPRTAQQKNDLLALVSFSMPAASLSRLAGEAARSGAVLVFRGLKDNSMKSTMTAFMPYSKMGARAEIDPTVFQRYDVKTVPRYVLNSGDRTACAAQASVCAEQALQIGGDVSLEYALERMATSRHALASTADRYLETLRGRP